MVVYSNDFETHTDGFEVTHTEVLPSDDVGGTLPTTHLASLRATTSPAPPSSASFSPHRRSGI